MEPQHRSKRAIRTPKRFDDEAFETPPKPLAKPIEVPEPSPEPAQNKSIIKVKLSKAKPTEVPEPSPEPTPNKSIIKVKLSKVKPREIPKQTKDPIAKPKEVLKVKETPKPKEVVKLKPASSESPKELAPPLPPPPVLQDREVQLIHRPRMRRPRTPPAYADLIPNVVLPFWDARTAAEDHEDDNVKELVHCQCGIMEELGLMIQCETCLTWQHAHCLGMESAEEVPDGYACRACSDPKFARESMKWAYDQDWLTKGRMKQFACDPNPIEERSVSILQKINQLIGYTLNIHQLIHSLRVKNRILLNASDDDPELKLFRIQWPADYQHHDGTSFIPTVNNPASTPASTISVMGETPDPGDIVVENVSLEDVSAILDIKFASHPEAPSPKAEQPATPNDCRSNLRLHIQQTEEFIGIELAHIEEQLVALEKECKNSKLETSLESLKNDLQTMRKYLAYK